MGKKTKAANREENKRTKEATEKGVYDEEEQKKIGGEWKFCKRPEFLKRRNDMFTSLYAAQVEGSKDHPQKDIKITVDGKQYDGTSFKTCPFDVAKMIDKEKAKTLIVSKVKYPKGRIFDTDAGVSTPELSDEKKKEDPNDKFMWWDATRPFEGDCELKLFAFSD